MRYIYTFLFYLILPAILLRLLWRSIKSPDYAKRWAERFGFFAYSKPAISRQTIWIHSVSLGETLAAVPLIKTLQKKYPNAAFVVTTMTPTGSRQVHTSLGDSVFHVYAPYDVPDAIHRFLRRIQPSMLIIIETELWPNLIHYSAAQHIPIVLANARLSARSAKGYQRFKRITHPMLNQLSLLMVQSQVEAERFAQLGMPSERIKVTGNMKFDITVSDQQLEQARALCHSWGIDRPVWIAASTHTGEEKIVLAAFKQILGHAPDALLILVPRHPERLQDVLQLCEQAGCQTVLRSTKTPVTQDTSILLVDTIGELLLFYAASDVAFVGGSFVPVGGHNLLEPAVLGIPTLTGPHMFNFAEINQRLQTAQAVFPVTTQEELAQMTLKLLQDPQQRKAAGEKGKQVVLNNRGALQAHIDGISQVLRHE